MRARWTAIAGIAGVLVAATGLVLTLSGSPAQSVQRAFSTPALEPQDDPLLIRARSELASGGLSDETTEALLASEDPKHARARRVLLAMDAEAQVPEPAPAKVAATADLVVPTLATTASTPSTPRPASTSARSQSAATPAPSKASAPKLPDPPGSAALPTLSKVSLNGSSKGATLTLNAGSGVVVGVANQKSSGIVRLLVEAKAGHSVLSARPRVRGARVSSVRRVGRTVFVTLNLDPGWSLDRIRKTGRGARVELRAPT